MVTPHITNKEFEALIAGKQEELSPEVQMHMASCRQCRQEYAELSSVFHWPASSPSEAATHQLTEQVFTSIARHKRAQIAKRMLLTLGIFAVIVLLFSISSLLWEYLPQEIRTTMAGLFPVMEWAGSFNKAFAAENWLSLSA